MHKDIEFQRQKLIDSLIAYRKHNDHEITVVFDGWKSGGHDESRFTAVNVNVVYSRLGENADSVIKTMLGKGQRQYIVVSSDRDIQAYAWSHNSIPLNAEDFLQALEAGKEGGRTPKSCRHHQKGNPKRPSKKDRAVKRAISKL